MTKRKYNSHKDLINSQNETVAEPMYISWKGKNITEQQKAFAELGKTVDAFTSVSRAHYRDFSDLDTNTSGRPGLTYQDYSYFRPDESIPKDVQSAMLRSDQIYRTVGLIRNIIDLMGDFACQGICLVHPNKKTELWYQKWFSKISGKERSERFLNNLYRIGNVCLRRQTAKITLKQSKELFRGLASPDLEVNKETVYKREIPWHYTFLNPSFVSVVGGHLSSFSNNKAYSIQLPYNIRRAILNPSNAEEKRIVNDLPEEIRAAAKTNGAIMLDSSKTSVYHYKKDDWQTWAYPMIYAIMKDIIVFEKLKLADLAALDGAISNIRIFKLGNLEHQIMPTRAAVNKLSNMLENHTGAGTLDLIWTADIELEESKTTVHQFLGEEKYKPTLNNIYSGLGIPPTLTGTFGSSGTTNNFVSLQTLIQRLEYGRDVLTSFWEKEIELVQKAMGFSKPAKVEFKFVNLGDAEAEKALLIQLADRSIISDELIQRRFGHDPEMEAIRINREQKDRDKGKKVPKAGPYHDPGFEEAVKRIFVQTGIITPSELGIELEPRKPGEKSLVEISSAPQNQPKQNSKPAGRPKNSNDKTPRKRRQFKPQSKAIELWAKTAQELVAETINPLILKSYNKKNMRSLSSEEQGNAELFKFGVLINLKPFSNLSSNFILKASKEKLDKEAILEYQNILKGVAGEMSRVLSIEEQRYLQTSLYGAYNVEDSG